MSRSIRRPEEGLTLAELLVVIAILGLLAVAAAPSILEAQTRAKVAAAKAHTRLLASALEAYAVDRGSFPPAASAFPDDPLGLLAEEQLRVLTEPSSAHLSESAFRDPFGLVTPAARALRPARFPTPCAPRWNYRRLTRAAR
jgi:prepilin-type N-terminal cleavage/methylation domain-containing protein